MIPLLCVSLLTVNTEGRRDVLGLAIGPSEAETFWTGFLRRLTRRGLRGLRLVILFGRLLPLVSERFPWRDKILAKDSVGSYPILVMVLPQSGFFFFCGGWYGRLTGWIWGCGPGWIRGASWYPWTRIFSE